MRLLNTKTLQLEDFFDEHPKYAILSHRWQDGEVSLQDMQNGTASKKPGYWKIKTCCSQAVKDCLTHAWVDTCCIDKTSSAELTEAINSMYRWYEQASTCYAFLFDAEDLEILGDSSFGRSAWWSRGWTLQELLAPLHIVFYNSRWEWLGTKSQLGEVISKITGIDLEMLMYGIASRFSVAKRMSWASKRTTTRVEDMAYSLLGLFDVNMPMLYGEGEKAFIRLQEEIMKHSDDHSIFAWRRDKITRSGLLASSPASFASCHDIVISPSRLNRAPYFTTNMGLSIQLPMIPWAMNTYLAALDCEKKGVRNSRVGIFLELLPDVGQCSRTSVEGKDQITFHSELIPKSEYKNLFVRRGIPMPSVLPPYGFHIRSFPLQHLPRTTAGDKFLGVTSWDNKWDDRTRMLEIPTGKQGMAGILWWKVAGGTSVLKVGFDTSFNPICQCGGYLFGVHAHMSYTEKIENASFDEKMDVAWMKQDDEWIMRGDRIDGLQQREWNTTISIKQGLVKGVPMWVVDLECLNREENYLRGPKFEGIMCDGCEADIYGVRYRCSNCHDFDYCSECYAHASETHPSDHVFLQLRKDNADLLQQKGESTDSCTQYQFHGADLATDL